MPTRLYITGELSDAHILLDCNYTYVSRIHLIQALKIQHWDSLTQYNKLQITLGYKQKLNREHPVWTYLIHLDPQGHKTIGLFLVPWVTFGAQRIIDCVGLKKIIYSSNYYRYTCIIEHRNQW